MDAADFILICPQSHQTLQICTCDGVVERVFYVVGGGKNSNRIGHKQRIFFYTGQCGHPCHDCQVSSVSVPGSVSAGLELILGAAIRAFRVTLVVEIQRYARMRRPDRHGLVRAIRRQILTIKLYN